MLITRAMQLNGMDGINYAGLSWRALADEVMAAHEREWERNDRFDPFSGFVYSATLGKQVQAYLNGLPGVNGDNYTGPPGTAGPYGWYGYDLLINFKDPDYVAADGSTDWMTRLSAGPNNTVEVSHYKIDNGIPWGAFAIIAAPFAMAAMGVGVGATAGVAEVGIAEAVGWTSGYDLAMGADLLSMTGAGATGAAATVAAEVPAWTSGYDLAMGQDLLSMTGGGAAAVAPEVAWTSGYDLPMGQDLLSMTGAGTVSSPDLLSSMQKAMGTVRNATGLVSTLTSVASAAGGSRMPVRTSTAQVYPQQMPQVTTQYVHARPADDKTMMIGLGVGVAVLALLLTRG